MNGRKYEEKQHSKRSQGRIGYSRVERGNFNLRFGYESCCFLNQTSAIVWQNCDGTKTVSEFGAFLAKELNNPINEDLIWLALDQLKKENLIENSKELEIKFEGVSRREAVRKIGMASL